MSALLEVQDLRVWFESRQRSWVNLGAANP